jgi:hypothetical protein
MTVLGSGTRLSSWWVRKLGWFQHAAATDLKGEFVFFGSGDVRADSIVNLSKILID